MLDLGRRIRALRKEQRISQVTLAKMVGVSQSAIAQLETGTIQTVKANHLLRLSAALRTNPYYLMTGKGAKTDPSAGGAEASAELVAIFENLSDENRAAILAAAKALAVLPK